jgi:hypothetical protein
LAFPITRSSGPQWKLGSLRGQKPASGESLRYQIRKAIMLLGGGVIARLAEPARHPSDLGVIARLGERV